MRGLSDTKAKPKRRQPAPWLRSCHEPVPARRQRRTTPPEAVIVAIVVVAVIAMAIWFFAIASGGIGPGSV